MDILGQYWSHDLIAINALLVLNIMGAAACGVLTGYERSYHGRAAGIRTYALVCMAACAVTVACAYPAFWFGGIAAHPVPADPTRVIQGILTGIGFLGAGVIMKEGFSIRGLSTSASIWMTAAIGILIGLGFYAAAIFATLATTVLMSRFRAIENALPHQVVQVLTLTFPRDNAPTQHDLATRLEGHGFRVADWSYAGEADSGRITYSLSLVAPFGTNTGALAADLAHDAAVKAFSLTPARS